MTIARKITLLLFATIFAVATIIAIAAVSIVDTLVTPPTVWLEQSVLIIGFAGSGLFLSTLIATLYARRLTRPLDAINRELEGCLDGLNDDESIDSHDSLERVTASFNKMRDNLARVKNEMEQRNRAIDEHALVSVTDVAGVIVYVNKKFSELSGYDQSELLGQTHRILNSENQDRDYWKNMYGTISDGRVWKDEIRNRSKNGDLYWVDSTIMPIVSRNNNLKGYISIRTDVTARKKIELDLIAAREQAEESDLAKSEFLARMSHEIRTPINGVIGLTELALTTKLSPQQKDYLTKISSSSENLLGIINDILDFSKIEAKKVVLETAAFDLKKVVENALIATVPPEGIEVLLSYDLDLPTLLHGDALRISQVLINLVGNATKFTTKGQVLTTVKCEDNRDNRDNKVVVSFSVQDNGIGMNSQQLDGLFQSFNQGDTSTTRRYGGTGLGLAISKQLVDLMGGDLTATSSPGVGSTFTFTLEFSTLSSYEQKQYKIPSELNNKQILVVEDNPTAAEIIRMMLEKFGFDVVVSETGNDAIALLENRARLSLPSFELIFMDWDMPGLNGIETAQFIHRSKTIPRCPEVIMVSAYNSGHLISQAEKEGINNFIIKPVMPSLLFDTIINTLGYGGEDHPEKQPVKAPENDGLTKITGSNVLIAEDNLINQQVLQELLEQRGMVVTVVNNGAECLEMLNRKSFDLVFMDVQMPVLDGLAATREIRRSTPHDKLPIIAMTAHAMEDDKIKSIDAGMNAHLTKPINISELEKTMVSWIQEKELCETVEKITECAEEASIDGEVVVPTLNGFNRELGLSYVGGNIEFYNKLLRQFGEKYENLQGNIRENIENARLEDAERMAHTLKGVSGTLGATKLSELSEQLEEVLRNRKLIGIESVLVTFEVEFEIVISTVKQYINSISEPQPVQETSLDKEHVVSMLAELVVLLKQGNSKSYKLFEKVNWFLNNSGFSESCEKIAEAIDDLEFDIANDEVLKVIEQFDGERSID